MAVAPAGKITVKSAVPTFTLIYTQPRQSHTASLIGDVPGGVMLNRRPIFLGGQGGLVGPVPAEFRHHRGGRHHRP